MRKGDQDKNKSYFRSSERIFRMNGAWYFAAREGDQGPYRTEQEAQVEVDRFLIEQRELAQFQSSRDRESVYAKAPGVKLELVPLDQRPRVRKSTAKVANRKVMI